MSNKITEALTNLTIGENEASSEYIDEDLDEENDIGSEDDDGYLDGWGEEHIDWIWVQFSNFSNLRNWGQEGIDWVWGEPNGKLTRKCVTTAQVEKNRIKTKKAKAIRRVIVPIKTWTPVQRLRLEQAKYEDLNCSILIRGQGTVPVVKNRNNGRFFSIRANGDDLELSTSQKEQLEFFLQQTM
jgi:hypothetical protein